MTSSETILPRCRALKPRQALGSKTFFPAGDEILAAAFLFHDCSIRLPCRQPQDHLSTPHFSGLHRSRSRPFLVPAAHAAPISALLLTPTNLPNNRFGNQ